MALVGQNLYYWSFAFRVNIDHQNILFTFINKSDLSLMNTESNSFKFSDFFYLVFHYTFLMGTPDELF